MRTTKILDVRTENTSLVNELIGCETYIDKDEDLCEHLYLADTSIIPESMTVKNQQHLTDIIMKCARNDCAYFRLLKI